MSTEATAHVLPETTPTAPEMDITPQDLRRVFGNFATGVVVATTLDAHDNPVGVTVNSYTSVSMSPPLVLFCLDNRSANLSAFEDCGAFVINILADDQQTLSRQFASKVPNRFEGVPWSQGQLEQPILHGALAFMECEAEQIYEGGDHRIIVGRVRYISTPNDQKPLLYFQGGFQALATPSPTH